jgi:hypothetical protein
MVKTRLIKRRTLRYLAFAIRAQHKKPRIRLVAYHVTEQVERRRVSPLRQLLSLPPFWNGLHTQERAILLT